MRHPRTRPAAVAVAVAATITVAGSGCMALTPQLAPTHYETLEKVEDRGEREHAYANNTIYRHEQPQGTRYTKGTDASAQKRSWQSLDAVLRSDANSAALLPKRSQRLARVFTALTIAAGIVTIAGAAASAREGLDLGSLNGTGGLLLAGGLATVGFGITGGVFYGKTKQGYEAAVDVYNDSLGMRLGILTPTGEYVPPRGSLVDEQGFVVLEENERTRAPEGPQPPPAEAESPPQPEPEPGQPQPAPQPDGVAAEPAPTQPTEPAADSPAPGAAEGDASAPAAAPSSDEPAGPSVVEPPGPAPSDPSAAAKLSLRTR